MLLGGTAANAGVGGFNLPMNTDLRERLNAQDRK
jgi:hypothetical protein